jgi:hypothetical protein
VIRAALVLAIVGHAGIALAGHCTEVSPVLGHRHCGRFGSRWATSTWLDLWIQPAIAIARIPLSPSEAAAGTAYSATSSTGYQLHLAPGTELHPVAVGARFRVGYHGPLLTLAFETTFGVFADGPTVVTTLDSGAAQTTRGGDYVDIAGVVGMHHRWNRITLGGELAVGERSIYLQGGFPDGYTGCPGAATGRDCEVGVIADTRLLVEPAASVEWWVHRQVTLTATAGYDIAGGGEVLAIGVAVHDEPFDGD